MGKKSPITLELSPQEAQVLADILYRIGGCGNTSPRKYADLICAKLNKAHYYSSRNTDSFEKDRSYIYYRDNTLVEFDKLFVEYYDLKYVQSNTGVYRIVGDERPNQRLITIGYGLERVTFYHNTETKVSEVLNVAGWKSFQFEKLTDTPVLKLEI